MLETGITRKFYPTKPREGAKRFQRIRHGKFLERNGRNYAALLLVSADADFIDASYEDIVEGSQRTFAKAENEGYRTEAHLVFDLEPEFRGGTQVYSAVLEESPGLSGGVVHARLSSLLRKAGLRKGQNNAKEEQEWGPIVTLDALASASLIDEIVRGNLEEFDLVRDHIESKGIDEYGDLVERRLSMKISVTSDPDKNGVIGMIGRVRDYARRKEFDDVRIRYTEAGTKKTKLAVVNAVGGADESNPAADAIEKLVSRTCKVDLAEPMHYDHSEVVDAFVMQAIDKLAAEKGR